MGDAFFSKIILSKKNFKKLIVVTSDWHIERSKIIFDSIYGKKFQIKFLDIKTKYISTRIEKEKDSLKNFFSTFNPMPLNDKEFFKTMIEKHPFYNGKVYEKIKFYENSIFGTRK